MVQDFLNEEQQKVFYKRNHMKKNWATFLLMRQHFKKIYPDEINIKPSSCHLSLNN